MPDPLSWAILGTAALAGSIVGGVAGFGAGVILLPVVAAVMGVRAAVPILTITMLLGNLSRVWWSRGEIEPRVVWRYLAGAIPATFLGAALLVATPSRSLNLVIGCFLVAAVPLRRLLAAAPFRVRLAHFPLLGAAIGLLSALVVTTGPVMTPFFLAYGLRRGAYIATEAACALVMHAARGLAFARYALLGPETILLGLVLGGIMFVGSWLGRRLVDRMSERVFLAAVEVLLVGMGLHLLLLAR